MSAAESVNCDLHMSMQAITERSEMSKSEGRSLRHNSSSGRTHDHSLPHNSSDKEGNVSLQRIQEGDASANGASAEGRKQAQRRDSMNSAVIDLLSTKCAAACA